VARKLFDEMDLRGRTVAAEDIGFPFAAPVALVTRQHVGRKDETVGLIADLSPQELPAQAWLRANPGRGQSDRGRRLGDQLPPQTRLSPSCMRCFQIN
jgi:hypothetical protein